MMKPAMSPTLQTLTYSAAGAPFLVGRSAACAPATTTRVAAEPSRRLFVSVIVFPSRTRPRRVRRNAVGGRAFRYVK